MPCTPRICYSGKWLRFPVTFPLFKLNIINCILVFHRHIQKYIFVHLNSALLGIASIFCETCFPIYLKIQLHSQQEAMLHQWRHIALVAFIDQSDWIKLFEIQFLPEVIKIACLFFFKSGETGRRRLYRVLPPFQLGRKKIASLI